MNFLMNIKNLSYKGGSKFFIQYLYFSGWKLKKIITKGLQKKIMERAPHCLNQALNKVIPALLFHTYDRNSL